MEKIPTLRHLLFTVLLAANAAAADPAPARVIPLQDLPLLFVDDGGVASRRDLVRRQHPARSHPKPIVVADRPWEGDRVYVFGTILHNPAKQLFEMWYVGVPGAGEILAHTQKVYVEGFREGGATPLLYATSRNGVDWDKPSLGLYAFNGSKDNNIVFDLDSATIIVDKFERDPSRRYKMVAYSTNKYWSAVSPDGLHWRNDPATPILDDGDTVTMAQNPVTGEFLVYHKKPQPGSDYDRRVVWLSRSMDFRNWTQPELVLVPDKIDDTWVTRPGERTEFYNMSVFPHAGGFLGLPTIFRVEYEGARGSTGPGQSRWAGPIDVEIASSLDGRQWQRAWPRMNIIPQGDPGTFNGGAILGLATAPVHYGRETWVYYTVLTTNHGGAMPPKRIAIARAEWRRDGYVSLDAGPEGGRLETVPLRFARPELILNADARLGQVRAAVLEADGRPIAGLGFAESEPLREDTIKGAMRWRGGARVPTDRPVRVALELTSTRLYSVASTYDATGDTGN
ncbi:MAG: hypothetical protein JNG83_11140 [Opitutaceae bacterium]|nr:hypothetical protein [Opitutaceae bacterium]